MQSRLQTEKCSSTTYVLVPKAVREEQQLCPVTYCYTRVDRGKPNSAGVCPEYIALGPCGQDPV